MTQLTASSPNAGRVASKTVRTARPQAKGRRKSSSLKSFLAFVALPTAAAAFYYGAAAVPIYVSESKFIVRAAAPPASNAFSSYLQSSGITRSQDDTFSVQEFLDSRTALRELQTKLPFRSLFARSDADALARFPRPWDSDTFEGLYRYYKDRIDVVHNDTTGITTLCTMAFRAADAYAINRSLLEFGSRLLQRMNDRARTDAVAFSSHEVATTEQRLLAAQSAITTFRNRELMIDPSRTSTKMLDLIARLSMDLATTRARRAEIVATAPDSAALPFLTNRVEALQGQIDAERAKVVGSDAAIAPRIAEYERLTLDREFADKSLVAASNALDAARADARRQQLYLETIVEPTVADEALEPQRLRTLAIFFLALCTAYFIGRLLLTAIRDHRAG